MKKATIIIGRCVAVLWALVIVGGAISLVVNLPQREYLLSYDPNQYDPNYWHLEEPENPIIYIDHDTFRLLPGSSIKYIQIGDPNVEVTYFTPDRVANLGIELADPNAYGWIIKNCTFDCRD